MPKPSDIRITGSQPRIDRGVMKVNLVVFNRDKPAIRLQFQVFI